MVPIVQRSLSQPAAPVAPQAPTSAASPNFDDETYITGGQFKSALAQATQSVSPQVERSMSNTASMAYRYVQDQHRDDFKRWQPEIDAAIAMIPVTDRTLDTLEKVVKFVRGNHADELIEERAQARAEQLLQERMAPGALRSNGGSANGALGFAAPLPTDEFDLAHAPAAWQEKARALGLNGQAIRDFCLKTDTTPKQFFEDLNLQTDKVPYGR